MTAEILAAVLTLFAAAPSGATESSSAHYTNVSWTGGSPAAPAPATLRRESKRVPERAPPARTLEPPAAPAPAPAPVWPWIALGAAFVYAAAVRLHALGDKRERAADETLAMAAHELKSPLAAIESYLDLMASEAPGDAVGTRQWLGDVAHMKSTAAHLRRTIGDMLDMTRIEDGRMKLAPRPLPLAPIVADAAAVYAAAARERGVGLVAEVPRGLPDALVDADRLRQVLHNLVGNALKYTPAGGNVFVGARCEGDRLVVEVRDDGVGVPAGRRARLFEKFARLAPALDGSEGTGLGLYISRRLVEAQGGRISYAPGPGDRGSVLSVVLPRAAGS